MQNTSFGPFFVNDINLLSPIFFMDKRLMLIIIPLACFFGVFGAYFLYNNWYIVDVQHVPVRFTVVEGMHIGLNLDRDGLVMGSIPQGGSAQRTANISSIVDSSAHFSVSENIAGWLHPGNNPVILEGNVPQVVNFTLRIPENVTLGNYTGDMVIVYTRRLW